MFVSIGYIKNYKQKLEHCLLIKRCIKTAGNNVEEIEKHIEKMLCRNVWKIKFIYDRPDLYIDCIQKNFFWLFDVVSDKENAWNIYAREQKKNNEDGKHLFINP
jgi:hypothetical protein